MAKTSQKVSIRVSNTFAGSTDTRTDEFVHELDRNGRWIPTVNLRIVADADLQLPAELSASKIQEIQKQKPSLLIEEGSAYRRTRSTDLEPNEELELSAGKSYIYKPIRPDVVLTL